MKTMPLYRRILGADFERMPAPIRALHDVTDRFEGHGTATVEHGDLFARRLAKLLGIPGAGRNLPIRVEVRAKEGGELLSRFYPDRTLRTFQTCEETAAGRVLGERFGPFRLELALTAHEAGLDFRLVRWRLGKITLPMALAPRVEATERAHDRYHHFRLRIALPLLGLLFGYEGDVDTGLDHGQKRSARFDVL